MAFRKWNLLLFSTSWLFISLASFTLYALVRHFLIYKWTKSNSCVTMWRHINHTSVLCKVVYICVRLRSFRWITKRQKHKSKHPQNYENWNEITQLSSAELLCFRHSELRVTFPLQPWFYVWYQQNSELVLDHSFNKCFKCASDLNFRLP